MTPVGTALISSLLYLILGQEVRRVDYSRAASIAETIRWWAN
jgi:hypothetical protein